MNYSQVIAKELIEFKPKEIIISNRLYKEKFKYISEPTFYKVLSRLVACGELVRLSNGIYCKPKNGKFNKVIANEKDIIEYYIGKQKNKGVVTGYRLFNKYQLTTQVSKTIDILSTITSREKSVIMNATIKKIDLRLNQAIIEMIEFLEILQNYKKIEEISYLNLCKYFERTINNYNEEIVEKILKKIKYKKSTIASLVNILNYYKIDTRINEHLNGISNYKSIEMEKIYAVAS